MSKPLPEDVMRITFGAHTCKFERPLDAETEDTVRQLLAYKPTDASFKRVVWVNGRKKIVSGPEVKYLYNRRTREFPTGFLHKVLGVLQGRAEVINMPPQGPARAMPNLNGVTPRHYQESAFMALVGASRGVAIVPTGCGKTLIASLLAAAYPEFKVLITAPNINLLEQNQSEMARFMGEPVGILGDGRKELGPRVVVSTIQSLASRIDKSDPEVLKFLTSCAVWISDESHGAAADSYRALSKALGNANIRLGMTATWMREDGCEPIMEGVLGDVVYRYSYAQAFEEGFLTPIRVWVREFNHPGMSAAATNKSDFQTVYKNRIVNNAGRNLQIALDAATLKDEGLTPCLVLVSKIDHGEQLAELLDAPFINGEDNKGKVKNSKTVLDDFVSGKHPILVASKILNVGVNIPPLRSAINAAAGDSRIDALQKPGRGLRLFKGKNAFDYIDYTDREPSYLKRHSGNRTYIYRIHFPSRVTRVPQGWSLSQVEAGYTAPLSIEEETL